MSTADNSVQLLQRGIHLEDGGIVLGWNSPRDTLRQLGEPQQTCEAGKRLTLTWHNRRWLHGLGATFCTTLGATESFRRVDLLAMPGARASAEFQRLNRHLAMHLAAATHATDKPGSSSRLWQRGDIRIALICNSATNRLQCRITCHGPPVITEHAEVDGDRAFAQHLHALGLDPPQWRALKNYLLDLEAGYVSEPPAGLREHRVVQLAKRFVATGDRTQWDEAAGLLTGSRIAAWLILNKS